MNNFNWPYFLKVLGIFLLCIFVIISGQTYINGQVSKQIQKTHENYAKILADTQSKCENEKINQSTELNKKIIDLEAEISKMKLLLEKIKKQDKITGEIRRDVNQFIKQFDELTGVKGKNDANK